MKPADFFSADYASARERFRHAARRLAIPPESHAVAATGPQGESLTIDVATIGPSSARRAVILSSAVSAILAAGLSARSNLPRGERPGVLALKAIARIGVSELQKTLLVGQYKHKNCLFYGGGRPEESTAWIERHLPVWLDGTDLTLHLDFHSGLGTWGDYQIFIADRRGSPRAHWVAERFGADLVAPVDEQSTYDAYGTMAPYLRDRNTGSSYHCLTAEFGTYPGIRVLGALRAENQAHFYGDRNSFASRRAKRKLVEAFAPAAGDWREAVVTKSLAIIARAIAVCGTPLHES